MTKNTYLYRAKNNIKTLKELNFELKRAELHQQFLQEILKKDKELVADAFSFQNILQTGMNALIGEGFKNQRNSNSSNSFFYSLLQWLLMTFLKKGNQ